MKSRSSTHIAAVSLLAALAIPFEVCGQNVQSESPKHHHYHLIDLGTLGGPASYFSNGNTARECLQESKRLARPKSQLPKRSLTISWRSIASFTPEA
jgi:hypothetical protein